jgi:hypothetical protein
MCDNCMRRYGFNNSSCGANKEEALIRYERVYGRPPATAEDAQTITLKTVAFAMWLMKWNIDHAQTISEAEDTSDVVRAAWEQTRSVWGDNSGRTERDIWLIIAEAALNIARPGQWRGTGSHLFS